MLEVVTAAPSDWQRVRAVRLAALADAPDAFWSVLAEEVDQPEAFWRARLAGPDRTTLLATSGGVVVGTASAGPHHDDPAVAGVYGVWVDPAARGRGVADALMAGVVAWARARGSRRLRLEVGDHNAPARRLYARWGLTPTGVRGAFPQPREHVTEHELAVDLGA